MESQDNFFRWIVKYFVEQTKQPPAENADAPKDAPMSVDLPVLVTLLRSAGFGVKYSDKSDVIGGGGDGCRIILVCPKSGYRVVMEGGGGCSCPPEQVLQKIIQPGRPIPRPSTTASSGVQQTQNGQPCKPQGEHDVQDTVAMGEEAATQAATSPGSTTSSLTRQKTWSRDDFDLIHEDPGAAGTAAATASEARRLSAPPASSWTSITGDDLNIMAATEMIQEALSLLAGVSPKPPAGVARTAYGGTPRTGNVALRPRRVSSDAFLIPREPVPRVRISRSSSMSSGLASSVSVSSVASTGSGTSVGTPRPPPKSGTSIRRAVSAAAASSAATCRPNLGSASRVDSFRKPGATSNSLASKVVNCLKAPSQAAPKLQPQSRLLQGTSKPAVGSAKISRPIGRRLVDSVKETARSTKTEEVQPRTSEVESIKL